MIKILLLEDDELFGSTLTDYLEEFGNYHIGLIAHQRRIDMLITIFPLHYARYVKPAFMGESTGAYIWQMAGWRQVSQFSYVLGNIRNLVQLLIRQAIDTQLELQIGNNRTHNAISSCHEYCG